MSVLLETSKGDIVIDLFVDDCPVTTKNFIKLCKVKKYNFAPIYNVQKDYAAQMGDQTATGKHGQSIYGLLKGESPGYFKDEIRVKLKHTRKGTVAMANLGENLNDSRFYITLADNLHELDGKHTIFGQVAEGFDVLDKINEAYCDNDGRPFQDIRIRHTVILDDPFDDLPGMFVPETSPEPTPEQLATVRVPDDADLTGNNGKTEEQIEREIREREAQAQALTLEMVGDLPYAEVRPPENVLFVCKLNPITQDRDLELIFSRFGPVVSAQVIRDQKTGDSLQYAFVEFENKENCEEAYLKMDNVLIDDRRIHVDFSQSVSKLQVEWRKGRESMVKQNVELKRKYQQNLPDQKYELVFDHDTDIRKRTKTTKETTSDDTKSAKDTKGSSKSDSNDRGRNGRSDRGDSRDDRSHRDGRDDRSHRDGRESRDSTHRDDRDRDRHRDQSKHSDRDRSRR